MSEPNLISGRHTRMAHVPRHGGGVGHHDLPVFDKSRSTSLRAEDRVGLRGSSGNKINAFGFRVTERDLRPATPVPFHEPDPDRFAKSEARRAQLERADARRAAAFGEDAPRKTDRISRNYLRPERKRAAPGASRKDITNPRGQYVEPPPEKVAVQGSRDGTTLRFVNANEAARCVTGDSTACGSNVRMALSRKNGTNKAYGWSWDRIADARKMKRT